MRLAFLKIVILLLAVNAAAQQSRQYSFKHFSVNNGLASNSVVRVVQDKDGFIWLATANGLQRYDGHSFITFKPKVSDSTSVPDVKITLMYRDTKDNLWLMGANKRIGIFDTRKFKFKEVPVNDKKELYVLQSFFEVPSGEMLLVRSEGDFLQYIPEKNQFVSSEFIPVPKNWKRTWVFYDQPINKYWLTCDSGVVMYDPVTKHLNYRGHNIDNDPVIKAFSSQTRPAKIFADREGNVAYVHWPLNGAHPFIHVYNRKSATTEKLEIESPGYYEIEYFLQQRNGGVWIYGSPFFLEWRKKNGKHILQHVPNVYRNEQSIRFDYMYDVVEDKQNNVWLASDNGLYVFNPEQQIFNTYYFAKTDGKPPFEAPIQSMEQLKNGNLMVGSWGSPGVTCYDRDFNPVKLPAFPYGEVSTWNMRTHPITGEVWICMQGGGGIVIYNQKKNSFKRIIPETFEGTTIRQVAADKFGNMWFGAHNGKIFKWDYQKSGGDASKGYEFITKTGLVHKVEYDGNRYVYAATLHYGTLQIDVLTGKTVRSFSQSNAEGYKTYSNDANDIFVYNDSTLIIADGAINVVNTKTNKITQITDKDGLPSNTTVSLLTDSKGILWVGMVNGICRVNLQKKRITYYDRRDGITDDKFNVAGAEKLNDGRLAFFTDHSFMIFDPENFNKAQAPSAPMITGFKLGGRTLNLDSIFRTERVVLNHNNTSISVNFSALSYLQQNKLLYSYRLEGVDEEWIRTDKPIEAVYNYLPPGSYTFKVKTETTDGYANPAIAALQIEVRAPFWKTWWFLSLIALLVITVLYLLDTERMKKRKAIHQLRNEIRNNLKEEVSSVLGNIHVLSEMAKLKAEKNPTQAIGFVEQISEKSKGITEVMNETLWSIDPENDRMLHTLHKMQEVSEEYSLLYNVSIEFSAEKKVSSLRQDMKQRHDMFLFYKESLQFILNNIETNELFVSIELVKGKLRLEILAETDQYIHPDLESDWKTATDKRVKALEADTEMFSEKNKFSMTMQMTVKA